MSTSRKLWIRCGLGFIVIAVAAWLIIPWRAEPSPLPLVSYDTNFGVSVRCTFGTNHVYYYGGPLDRLMDPAVRRLSSQDSHPPYRLVSDTPDPSTVVWVCLEHPTFGDTAARSTVVATPSGFVRYLFGDIPKFRALVTDSSGKLERMLERTNGLQQFRQRSVISGYVLPGQLGDYRGSFLRIESTDGEEVVTFRIP